MSGDNEDIVTAAQAAKEAFAGAEACCDDYLDHGPEPRVERRFWECLWGIVSSHLATMDPEDI